MAQIETCQLLHSVMPAVASPVSLTPNGTSWANSSWVEVEDSTNTTWLLTGVVVGTPGYSDPCHVEVGTGTAGAEVVIATIPAMMMYNANVATSWLRVPVPIVIPASTRVAVRLRKLSTNTSAWGFALTYYAGATPSTLTTTTQPLKALPASQISMNTLVHGADVAVWSPWAELSSGLSAEVALGWVVGNTTTGPNGWYAVEVGIGAAGAEVPIARLVATGATSTNPCSPSRWLLRPLIRIAVSTRIAARARGYDTGTRDYSVGVGYYEVPL